jgi:hypothetical protein
LSLVFLIELFSDSDHLRVLEVGELDRPPALSSPDHGAEHELQEIRRTDRAAVVAPFLWRDSDT